MGNFAGTLRSVSSVDAGLEHFKDCLKQLREDRPEQALLYARRAVGIVPQNPFYLSYTGLLTALTENRFGDAETFCQQAIGIKNDHPQLYLNLAAVYEHAKRPTDAIEVLEKALASAGRDYRVRHAREKLGRRREPVLPFLRRSHPLNRILGKCRHRLMGPKVVSWR